MHFQISPKKLYHLVCKKNIWFTEHFATLVTSKEVNSFELSLEYAAVDGKHIDSAAAKIYWNGDVLATLKAKDRKKHTYTGKVKVFEGNNNLTFAGTA